MGVRVKPSRLAILALGLGGCGLTLLGFFQVGRSGLQALFTGLLNQNKAASASPCRRLASEPYNPKGPCTQIGYTLAPKDLYRDYFRAKVYNIWAHGPLENGGPNMIQGIYSLLQGSWSQANMTALGVLGSREFRPEVKSTS